MYTLTLIPINDQVYHNLTVDIFTGLNGLLFLLRMDWDAIKSIEAVIVDHNIYPTGLIILPPLTFDRFMLIN